MICWMKNSQPLGSLANSAISVDSHCVLPPLFNGGFEKRDATARVVLADVVKEIRRERSSR